MAVPLIMAGVRTATVAVVATATLAAYVDAGGFGRYIVDGFAVQDDVKVFAGGLLVALLALAARAACSPACSGRSRRPGSGPRKPASRPRPETTPTRRATESTRDRGVENHPFDSPFRRSGPGEATCSTQTTRTSPMTQTRSPTARCVRPLAACSPWSRSARRSPPAGVAPATESRSPWGRRTSPARRRSRRPTGRRSRPRTSTSVQGQHRRHRGGLPGAGERRPRRLRRLPGHAAHLPRRHADRRLGRDLQGAHRRSSQGTGIVASKPAPAVDVNGFYVTKATAKKYKLKTLSDLAKVSDELSFGGPAECEERPLCLGDHVAAALRLRVHRREEARHGRPDHGPGARGRRHRRRAPVHRQQRDPEERGAAHRTTRACSRPTTRSSSSARTRRPRRCLKVLNGVSAKLTTAAYNDDVARHQRGQGGPGRRGRRLPGRQQPRLTGRRILSRSQFHLP